MRARWRRRTEKSATLIGVSPVLPVPDVRAAVAFYSNQLGFNAEELWGDPPTHGSVNRGRAGIQFTAAPDGYDPSSFPGSVYVFVDDVGELGHEFRSRGVEITEPAESKEYGMIEMAVRDLNGYRIVFGQYGHDH